MVLVQRAADRKPPCSHTPFASVHHLLSGHPSFKACIVEVAL